MNIKIGKFSSKNKIDPNSNVSSEPAQGRASRRSRGRKSILPDFARKAFSSSLPKRITQTSQPKDGDSIDQLSNSDPSRLVEGITSLELNSHVYTVFRVSDLVVHDILNESARNNLDTILGTPSSVISEAQLSGDRHFAQLIQQIAQAITERMGSVGVQLSCVKNLNRVFFNRDDLVPEWHYHVPFSLADPHSMFLMTLCRDSSLATSYSLSQNYIKIKSSENLKIEDFSSTSNIPTNSLVFFPVTRVHRTPIPISP